MSTAPARSAQDHASDFTDRQRTIALAIVAMAFIMDLLDSTIVNIAIPSIQSNLHASYTSIQWLVSGYLLAFALLLVTGGRMGDVFGYKKMFLIGVTGFTLASLLSGLAGTSEILVGARLLQGAMAALMVPQVMSLMQVMYKPEERAGVSGLFGALAGLAASAGPIVGGILIKANLFGLDWRPVFLINIPVGIFAFVAGSRLLPNGKSEHPLKLDIPGTLLVMAAITLLVYPLIQGRDLGWPLWIYVMMIASLPVFAIFWFYEKWRMQADGSALIVPEIFRFPSFSVGLAVNVAFEMAMIGMFFIFTLVLQIGLGYSVIKAAVTGIPLAIGISVSIAALSQALIPRLGRYLVTLGTLVMAAGLIAESLVISHFGRGLSPWTLAPILLVTGIGMGSMMAPIFAVVLNDVDPQHAGAASGLLNAIQQIGGAVGVALVGVLFFGQIGHQAYASIDAQIPQLRAQLTEQHLPAVAQDQIVNGVRECFNDRSNEKDASVVPASCQTAENAPAPVPAIADAVTNAALDANASNFAKAFRYGVYYDLALLALVFVLSFLLPRKFKAQEGH
jgi:EmrB/QacA subfamily drug resistance transporter